MHQIRWNKIILHICNLRGSTRFCTWAFAFSYIHKNDITQASSFNTTMFAYDINLHMSASNVRTLQRKVKDEIQNIDYWIRANKLSINYNKTSYITNLKVILPYLISLLIVNKFVNKMTSDTQASSLTTNLIGNHIFLS